LTRLKPPVGTVQITVDTPQNAADIINRDLEKNPSVVGKLACKIQSPENGGYGYFVQFKTDFP
jgi:hypothetical protein